MLRWLRNLIWAKSSDNIPNLLGLSLRQKEIQVAVAQNDEDYDLELTASDLEAFLKCNETKVFSWPKWEWNEAN